MEDCDFERLTTVLGLAGIALMATLFMAAYEGGWWRDAAFAGLGAIAYPMFSWYRKFITDAMTGG